MELVYGYLDERSWSITTEEGRGGQYHGESQYEVLLHWRLICGFGWVSIGAEECCAA